MIVSLNIHVRSLFTGELDFTGVALRAAFLSLLRQNDPSLSTKIHDPSSVQSYALRPFEFDSDFKTHFSQGALYSFGVNLLNSNEYGDVLRHILMNRDLLFKVYHQNVVVTQIDIKSQIPDALMLQWTKGAIENEMVRLALRFKTPTQLSQYGSERACLLPVPERVFPSLLRVWNTVSGATKIERVTDYRDWVEQNVSVSRHRIRTTEIELGRERPFVGFIGDVVYNVWNASEPFGRLTVGLAHFAELSNVGKNRTAGFGMVRLIRDATIHDARCESISESAEQKRTAATTRTVETADSRESLECEI